MTKDDIIDLIKDAGYGCLATIEDGQPRVRPMMPHLDDEGNLLFAMLSSARSIAQIKDNPAVEICYVDRKMSIARLTGKAHVIEDAEKKELVWNNIPMLRQYFSGLDDPNFVLLQMNTERIEAMTPQQKEADILDSLEA